ncbi:MAG: GNAT family N-acetyltransferase, partial [Gemmatimonadales bacterium]
LGVGKALMASLATRCVAENLASLDLAVLDWNAPAIGFYDSLGATTPSEWITRRLAGDALARLAAG